MNQKYVKACSFSAILIHKIKQSGYFRDSKFTVLGLCGINPSGYTAVDDLQLEEMT